MCSSTDRGVEQEPASPASYDDRPPGLLIDFDDADIEWDWNGAKLQMTSYKGDDEVATPPKKWHDPKPLTLAELPQTSLQDWREGRDVLIHRRWLVFNQFFEQQGIRLFVYRTHAISLYHPDDVPRSLDEPSVWKIAGVPEQTHSHVFSGLVHPGCISIDDRWVMIRLIRLRDEGRDQLGIVRFFSAYPHRADSRNHCLPCIREVTQEPYTFCVFPYMYSEEASFHYEVYMDVLEYVIQTIEGLAYLHSHLIAHRDIADANIVLNLAGHSDQNLGPGWRRQFPIRYYFIDFELAIRFPEGMPRDACRVVGRPSPRFGRPSAPEIYFDEPYDPFAADVFALGLVFSDYFSRVHDPVFLSTIERMLSIDPAARPRAEDWRCDFHSHRESLSGASLAARVEPSDRSDPRIHPNAILPPEHYQCR